MSDEGGEVATELPQLWQFIHPRYNVESDGEEEEEEEEEEKEEGEGVQLKPKQKPQRGRPADYIKLSKKAPRLGKLMRYLNDFEGEEDLQMTLLEKDPVTQQTLLQWAVLNEHFMLVEYLTKRLKRSAFAFNTEDVDMVVYNRWEEMRPELPSPAEVAERQKMRENDKAKRLAEQAMADEEQEEEPEEEDEEEVEPTPEELVYEALDEFHEEWGDRGVGIVKRIGELGVYVGTRQPDGTKQGLGQTIFPSGDCYAGEYKQNQREGRGVYWWSKTAAMYCGEWMRNLRHGYGRMVYPDGSRYLGYWVNGKRSGEGRYVYPDGSSYDGSWISNVKHGTGTYCFTDGSKYTGLFYDNAFVSGEWHLACGTVRYVGNFVKDVPVGAGVFVHRCGLKQGSLLQEGEYKEGQWIPTTTKGTTRAVPRIEIAPPNDFKARVPIEFSADCKGRTMVDLVKVANYAPLLKWVASLPSLSKNPETGMELKMIEVCSLRYSTSTEKVVDEVCVRPLIVDREGRRVRSSEDDTVTLKNESTRLLVLLDAPEASEPVVILEHSVQSASPDAGHLQYRLPIVRVTSNEALEGAVVTSVGPVLRLELSSTKTMAYILEALHCNPQNTNAEESVLLYAQQIHSEAFGQLSDKLKTVEGQSELLVYEAVPLSKVSTLSTDAITVIAASSVQQRRTAQTLQNSTTAPQRPPTPIPPPAEARPELQALYDAKARREEVEAEEEEDPDAQ